MEIRLEEKVGRTKSTNLELDGSYSNELDFFEILKDDWELFEEPLKSCPFCGCESVYNEYEDENQEGYHMTCANCYTRGPTTSSDKDAKIEWNKRE